MPNCPELRSAQLSGRLGSLKLPKFSSMSNEALLLRQLAPVDLEAPLREPLYCTFLPRLMSRAFPHLFIPSYSFSSAFHHVLLHFDKLIGLLNLHRPVLCCW